MNETWYVTNVLQEARTPTACWSCQAGVTENISGILGDLGVSTGMFATVFDMSCYSGQRRARSLGVGFAKCQDCTSLVAGKIAEVAEIQHRISLGV